MDDFCKLLLNVIRYCIKLNGNTYNVPVYMHKFKQIVENGLNSCLGNVLLIVLVYKFYFTRLPNAHNVKHEGPIQNDYAR